MSEIEIVCPECRGNEFDVSNIKDRFEYGAGDDLVELSAIVPVHTCKSCQFQFTGGDAEDARHEAVCRHLGRMTPAEIRNLRKVHALTRAELAALAGIGSASLARWENGQLIQGAAHDSLLYLLLSKSNLEKLAARIPNPGAKTSDRSSETLLAECTFVHITANDVELIQAEKHFSLHLH